MTVHDAFLAAEARLYAKHGLAPRSRQLSIALASGRVGVRVAELGRAAATPLVWVHGGGSFGAQFASMVAAVESRAPGQFRHVVVDRPGSGGSERFTYSPAVNLREHAVGMLCGVLDALGIDRAGFVANSMGGLWSLWTAHDRPARVTGLVLTGVPAVFLDTSAPFGFRMCANPWIGRRLMRLSRREQAAAVWARLGHPDAARVGDELLELTAVAARAPGWTEDFVSLLHQVLSVWGPRFSFEADEWRRVAVPVHLVWGDRDPFGAVSSALRAVELRPATQLDVIRNAGHLPWLDDVDTCVDAVLGTFSREGTAQSARERRGATEGRLDSAAEQRVTSPA